MIRTLLILCAAILFINGSPSKISSVSEDSINWITIEQALQLNEKKRQKKKIIIDLYTDWCGWCKRMDANTFANPNIIKYINDNYHAVKFDAEQKESVTYKEKVFEFRPGGRKGTNTFAIEVGANNGRMGYPTLAFLDENSDKIASLPGYKDPKTLDKYLRYYAEDYYKEFDFGAFTGMYESPLK